MTTPSVHRIMPHVPQKFYRIGKQQKLGLLLKLVKYDLSKKHPCLIFCNQTKTVRFLQQFFRDQRIEILVMHSQMTDTVNFFQLYSRINHFLFHYFRNVQKILNNFVMVKIQSCVQLILFHEVLIPIG
jgi:hypothetical protein